MLESPHPDDKSPSGDTVLPGPPLSRRKFLGFCSFFGIAGSSLYFSQKGLPLDVADQVRKLDSWWQNRNLPAPPQDHCPIPNTAEVRDYEAFLAAHPLHYLSPHEIIRPHFKKRGDTICGLPPRELWPNLLPTLRVADQLRQRLDSPLRIVVSAYRSPQYNAKCPGASRYSKHLQNRALDLIFDCGSEKAFAAAEQLRAELKFTGGLGLYDSFIHIDTRRKNATWGI